MNKRGDERILSLYWFVIFVIIAIAVVSGVYIFFSDPLDTRQIEGSILADKVIGCFVEQGKLSEVYSGINGGNFEEKCKLVLKDETKEAYKIEDQYYIEFKAGDRTFKYKEESESRFEPFCDKEESKKNIPICIKKKLAVLDETGELIFVEVLIGVRKVEQNAI